MTASRHTLPRLISPSGRVAPHAGPGGVLPRRRISTTARAPARASARMIGSATPMPGPESPEEPELPEPCEGRGAVAAAAPAVPFPSGPSLSRLRPVLGGTSGPPCAVPVPPDPFGPVGRFPPTPGMLSWYWSTPEFPGGTTPNSRGNDLGPRGGR